MTSAVMRSGSEYAAAALTNVHQVLNDVSDTPLWSSTDSQITELLTETVKLRNRLAALELRLVAEADSRDVAGRAAASSTESWLRAATKVAPAAAKKQVTLAKALTRELDLTRRAMEEGTVSASHALVIKRRAHRTVVHPGTTPRPDSPRQRLRVLRTRPTTKVVQIPPRSPLDRRWPHGHQ